MSEGVTITKDGLVNGNVFSVTINWDGADHFEALLGYLDDVPHVVDWDGVESIETGSLLDGLLDEDETEMLVTLAEESLIELKEIASKRDEQE